MLLSSKNRFLFLEAVLLVLKGLLWRHGLAAVCCGDRGTGSSSPRRGPLAEILFEVSTNTTTEPTDLRVGSPKAKQ